MAKRKKKTIKKTIKKKAVKKKIRPVQKPKGPIRKIKVKVIGVGNGGCAIVNGIAPMIKKAKFLAINTDRAALNKIKKIPTLQVGAELTNGFGTGMDISLGEKVAELEQERMKKVLENCDLCILVACLGGGTGSGMVPVLARISRKMGNITFGIFTLPFDFEAEKKLKIAKACLKKIKPFCHAISIVPNQSIFRIIDKRMPLKAALAGINKILAFSLDGLLDMIYKAGLINIDFADLKAVLTGRGVLAYLSRAEAKGGERAREAVEAVINNPLYPYTLGGANRILFNINGPPNLSLAEVAEISETITNAAKRASKVIFGVSQSGGGKIQITLLATGCEMRGFLPGDRKLPRKRKPRKKIIKIPEPVIIPQKKQTVKKKAPSKALLKTAGAAKTKNKNEKSKTRKTGLQVQKAIAELENELRKKEEVWEAPAFLRKEKS